MTSDSSPQRPIEALLARLGGGPTPGTLGLVAAGPGVSMTPMAVHVALDALLGGQRVLHITLTESVTRVRSFYDELGRATSGQGEAHEGIVDLERRRLVLAFPGAFAPQALFASVGTIASAMEFEADLVVLEGLDGEAFAAHRTALAAHSAEAETPMWVTVTSAETIPLDEQVSFGLRLSGDDAVAKLHLRDGSSFTELPWQLDLDTHLLGKSAAAAGPPPAAQCTLYSGGAAGSESAFGEAAERYGVGETHFTFEGHKQTRSVGAHLLGPRELEAGDVSLVYVSRRLNRTFNEHGLVRKVLQTLWHMVSRSQQIFVIGAIQEDGTVVGGTGWSVELARMWAKELWVFDQTRDGWYTWDGAAWQPGNAAIRSGQFCGTGTRYLDDNGRKAIDALFAAAFG